MNKQILRLAIPNIISNITVPMISTVDSILMGHLSTLHLGAIGIGAMIFNYLYWNFGFLRMGTTGMTAQAYGAEDSREIAATFYRAMLIALVVAVVIILLCVPLSKVGIYMMNVSPDQVPLVKSYYFTRIYDVPATLMLYVLLGWFFGMQDAISPLIVTVVINIANIVLSIYFVNVLEWDIFGVALGSVLGQYIGILTAIVLLVVKYRDRLLARWNDILVSDKLLNFLNVNRDLFLRTICLTTAFFFFFSQSSKAGAMVLAVNVILLQLINWMSYGIDGLAYAAESLVGKYKGAKDDANLHKAVKYVFVWAAAFAMLYSAVYAIGFDQIIYWFRPDSAVVTFAQDYYWWTVALPLVAFACYVWDGVFVGATYSKGMRDSMFLALLLFFVMYGLLQNVYAELSIWIALFVFLGARGIIQAVLWLRT